MDKTVVELFAGVGGFRVGLESAAKDFKVVWANQWEPSRKNQEAFQCYVYHFGDDNAFNCDISSINKETIPTHSLLVGGFPCQDYSVARTGAQGIQGKKGVLWWDIYDILKAKSPYFVLLENVDRLLKSPGKQRGRDFGVILACLNELNYTVEWRIINAAEYGFPQRRRRVFIFAFKNDTNYAIKQNEMSLEEIIEKAGFFQTKFKAKTIISNRKIPNTIKFEYKDIVDISEHFEFSFYNSGIMREGFIHTQELVPDPPSNIKYKCIKDILEENVDVKYFLNGQINDWKYLKGAKKIERTHKDGHKYIFSEGPIAFPDLIDKPSRTMLTSESSKNRSTHVIEDPQNNKLRLLTPIECERLNGFPDNWTKTGMHEKFRYFCMGNALVVGIIKELGTVISSIIDRENEV